MNQAFLLLSKTAMSFLRVNLSPSLFLDYIFSPESHQGRLSGAWTHSDGERTSQGRLLHPLRPPSLPFSTHSPSQQSGTHFFASRSEKNKKNHSPVVLRSLPSLQVHVLRQNFSFYHETSKTKEACASGTILIKGFQAWVGFELMGRIAECYGGRRREVVQAREEVRQKEREDTGAAGTRALGRLRSALVGWVLVQMPKNLEGLWIY